MRGMWKLLVAPVLMAGIGWAMPAKPEAPYLEVVLGEHTYRIPKEYGATSSGPTEYGVTTMAFQMSREDLSPLKGDIPGWEDNINLLITAGIASASSVYDAIYDGDPEQQKEEIRVKYERRNSEYIGSGLVLHTMKNDNFDVVVPEQDEKELPLGFMVCTKFTVKGSDNGCQLFFDSKGVRWKINFGRRYIHEYKEIREKVESLMTSFMVDKNDES